MLKTGSS